MQNYDKINPLNQEDRDLLSDLKATFDLGTQTIIGQDDDEIVDDLIDLMINKYWVHINRMNTFNINLLAFKSHFNAIKL